MEELGAMITCGACREEAVPAPVFVGEDGKRLDSVEERCSACGQLWQFPNHPPATLLDRRFAPEEPEPPEPAAHEVGEGRQ